jgi:uncharacterized protein
MSDEKKPEGSASGLGRRELLRAGSVAAAGAALGTLAPRDALAEEPAPQVPRRRLGKTGKEIPILLMGGAMQLDQVLDPKLGEALRHGINYFDTADCYAGGTSETAVGSFVARTKTREKVWITTKSDQWDAAGLQKTFATSLQRLKTDRVEMLFLHQLDDPKPLGDSEVARTAERLKKEGKIGSFGFSCHSGNVVELLNKASKLSWIDAIMFRYSFRQYGDKALNEAIDACAKADIGLIAMKTQSSESSPDHWKKFQQGGRWSKHQAVLKAVWEDKRIAAAVSHMDNFDKLMANIAAAVDKTKLGALDRQRLEQYAHATRAYACDGCEHLCNPAVEQQAPVQIGTTLRHLMYHDVYGQQDEARRRFALLPEASRRLAGVDFSLANAACPHGVDIAAHMARAAEVFGV